MNFKSKLAATVIALGFTAAVNAQTGFTLTTASASATIVETLSLSQVTGLQFGEVAVSSTAGTVLINSSNNARTPGGGASLPTSAATVAAAEFQTVGQANYGFTITLPSSAVTLSSGSDQITVTDFLTPSNTLTLDGSGERNFKVGATLNIPGGTAPGAYTGTYSVTVNYN